MPVALHCKAILAGRVEGRGEDVPGELPTGRCHVLQTPGNCYNWMLQKPCATRNVFCKKLCELLKPGTKLQKPVLGAWSAKCFSFVGVCLYIGTRKRNLFLLQ